MGIIESIRGSIPANDSWFPQKIKSVKSSELIEILISIFPREIVYVMIDYIFFDMKIFKTINVDHLNQISYLKVFESSNVMCSGFDDGTITVWDTLTQNCVHTLNGHTNIIKCMCLLSDWLIVSGSYDGILIIWDLVTGMKIKSLKGHTNCIQAVEFFNDGIDSWIISYSDDMTIRFWNPMTGKCQRIVRTQFKINSIHIMNGKIYAVSTSPIKICTIDKCYGIVDLKFLRHDRMITCVAFINGKIITGSMNGGIDSWDPMTWTKQELIGDKCSSEQSNCVNNILSLHDGKIVAGIARSDILIIDPETRHYKTIPSETIYFYYCGYKKCFERGNTPLVVLSDGHHIVSISSDNTIKVWNTINCECIWKIPSNAFKCIVVSLHDNQFAVYEDCSFYKKCFLKIRGIGS